MFTQDIRLDRKGQTTDRQVMVAYQVMGKTDIYIETTKQVAQIGVGPTIACSDTMLNTHGQPQIGKIKHDSTIFINK